jgi:hypothetical protein
MISDRGRLYVYTDSGQLLAFELEVRE